MELPRRHVVPVAKALKEGGAPVAAEQAVEYRRAAPLYPYDEDGLFYLGQCRKSGLPFIRFNDKRAFYCKK
jgi:hypothetical protein